MLPELETDGDRGRKQAGREHHGQHLPEAEQQEEADQFKRQFELPAGLPRASWREGFRLGQALIYLR
jgi:hypothetical protein